MFEVPTTLQANNLYECSNTSELINFYYSTMGHPVTSTWCKAIDQGYFRGWPGLTSDRPENKATWTNSEPASAQQGHEGDSPTHPPDNHMEEHEQTPTNDKTHMVFMTLVERGNSSPTKRGASQSHPTVATTIFHTLSNLDTADKEVYTFLRVRGYRPQLHKLDNKTSHDVELFIKENNVKLQYTPPDVHQTNPAEQAIRTWKNHFIAIRTGASPTCHLPNWCKDLEQMDIMLNMIRPWTTNPKLSAYEAM
eukprot:CCRYP_006029-RA/>CCRYP_006029-RA protein AED:0.43 eAED:0.43 QI:0/0/0/1/0/0/5/0/250